MDIIQRYNMTCLEVDKNSYVDVAYDLIYYISIITTRSSSCKCGEHNVLQQLIQMVGTTRRLFINGIRKSLYQDES